MITPSNGQQLQQCSVVHQAKHYGICILCPCGITQFGETGEVLPNVVIFADEKGLIFQNRHFFPVHCAYEVLKFSSLPLH